MVEQEIKRQTAYKCTIATLNKGIFVKKEGWESNYLVTEYGDFSRVNVIGAVVSKENNSIDIDDGSGQINGRLFDNTKQLDNISIGSIVLIVGRPREFNNRIYLTIEVVKLLDPRWIAYRRKELSLIKRIRDVESVQRVEEKRKVLEPEIIESTTTNGSKERIVKFVKELDTGDGAMIDDVLRLSKVGNGEELLSDMMMRGEVYESKAGRVKLM
jgi:RPA family protein